MLLVLVFFRLAVAFHRCYVLNSTPCFVSLACLMEDFWNVNKFCSVVLQNIFAVSQLRYEFLIAFFVANIEW